MNRYYDDINKYYALTKPTHERLARSGPQVLPRNASSSSNIIGILDAITSDMRLSLLLAGAMSKKPLPTLVWTGGLLACPGGQNTTCEREELRMTIPQSVSYYPNGTVIEVDGSGPFLAPVERSLINTFTALQDAYQYVSMIPTMVCNTAEIKAQHRLGKHSALQHIFE
jgi:hypothetical protein